MMLNALHPDIAPTPVERPRYQPTALIRYWLSLNDTAYLRRLACDGHTQRLRWFSDHWPADVAWPAGVDRPAHAETA